MFFLSIISMYGLIILAENVNTGCSYTDMIRCSTQWGQTWQEIVRNRIWSLCTSQHGSTKFERAILKHGAQSFLFSLLQACETAEEYMRAAAAMKS
jgi:hypothetical protein